MTERADAIIKAADNVIRRMNARVELFCFFFMGSYGLKALGRLTLYLRT